MEKQGNSVREYGQFLSVAVTALLFGSVLILSAVGPASASEFSMIANRECPASPPYLA